MKISVIGAGAMGGATVEGLIKGQQFKNEDITVSDPSQAVVDKVLKTVLPLQNSRLQSKAEA